MRHFFTVVLVGLFVSGANAASLIVDANGILLGADQVNVDNALYNVRFLDGTCGDLYNGCDEIGDASFAPPQPLEATASALRALMDQVFLDGPLGAFDTDPSLINGCSLGTDNCLVSTLGYIEPFGSPDLASRLVTNAADEGSVQEGSLSIGLNFATATPLGPDVDLGSVFDMGSTGGTNAVFTPVPPIPLPASFTLLASCVLGGVLFARSRLIALGNRAALPTV